MITLLTCSILLIVFFGVVVWYAFGLFNFAYFNSAQRRCRRCGNTQCLMETVGGCFWEGGREQNKCVCRWYERPW